MKPLVAAIIYLVFTVTPAAQAAEHRVITQKTADLALPGRPDMPAHAVRLTIWQSGDDAAPVLLYEPGWAAQRTDNDGLVNGLAAQGFTVVTIDTSPPQPEDAAHRLQTLQAPMDFGSAARSAATVQRGDQAARLFATDASLVLDRLPSLGVPLAMRPVGIFGFSFGGAVAAQACWQDPRFQAAANLDGWLFADAAAHWINQPYLLIDEESGDPSPPDSFDGQEGQRAMAHFAARGGTLVLLNGPAHTDFAAGGAPRVQALAEGFVGSFFRQVFAGASALQFDALAAQFPEAKIRTWPRGPE